MRKLVTVREVGEILPIENADAIELIKIDGWQVVSKKGEFQTGDKCVFFEIDSFLPTSDSRFSFLSRNGVRTVDGIERVRLKTIRLRGELSQGLALPLDSFPEVVESLELAPSVDDFSELLGVIKYEIPDAGVTDMASGSWPHWLRKTDEERIQNCYNRLKRDHKDTYFIPTLKLDGSSCTVAYLREGSKHLWNTEHVEMDVDGVVNTLPSIEYHLEGGEGVAQKVGEYQVFSRNIRLKIDLHNGGRFIDALRHGAVMDKVKRISDSLGVSIAVQGEVMGEGIQGNKEKFSEHQFFAFNLFDIDNQEYLDYGIAYDLFRESEMQQVPTVNACKEYAWGDYDWEPLKVFDEEHYDFCSLEQLLEMAVGQSINAKIREGLVFKSVGISPPVSFKVISNEFLLKSEG